MPWAAPSRAESVRHLEQDSFDVLVIGGGCVGAGCALEASTRGLKVALVERSDFAAGTSGRSTKLIHGGIRYLESAFMNLDKEMYELVQEALAEVSTRVRARARARALLACMCVHPPCWGCECGGAEHAHRNWARLHQRAQRHHPAYRVLRCALPACSAHTCCKRRRSWHTRCPSSSPCTSGGSCRTCGLVPRCMTSLRANAAPCLRATTSTAYVPALCPRSGALPSARTPRARRRCCSGGGEGVCAFIVCVCVCPCLAELCRRRRCSSSPCSRMTA
ncbi:FAD-dependent oxidoreductase [archaeon]|nr:MAG: FAD-dependent oxidoreductase [archaeon]